MNLMQQLSMQVRIWGLNYMCMKLLFQNQSCLLYHIKVNLQPSCLNTIPVNKRLPLKVLLLARERSFTSELMPSQRLQSLTDLVIFYYD